MQVSREPPPPLPGGWKVKDPVYFKGASKTWDDGDKVEYGQQGEVVGPATAKSHSGRGLRALRGKGVAVLFPGNKGNVQCPLTEVRCPRPALAHRLPSELAVGARSLAASRHHLFLPGDRRLL